MKTAAIKKEYINDFTPEELEQFKSDLKSEHPTKKVYRIHNDDSKVLYEENHGFEVPNDDFSLFPNLSKNMQEQSAYMNFPTKAPEQ